MYGNGLSLANISKLAKGGALKKSTGGVDETPKEQQPKPITPPQSVQKTTATAQATAQATTQAPLQGPTQAPVQGPTQAPVQEPAEAPSAVSSATEAVSAVAVAPEQIQAELQKNTFEVIKSFLKLLWKIRSGKTLIILFVVGFILSLSLLVTVYVSHKKVEKIAPENRYNKDLPEYKVARSGEFVYMYFIIIGMAVLSILIILSNFAIMYIKWDEYDKTLDDETGKPLTDKMKNWNTMYLGMFIVNIILLITAVINYRLTQKKIKNIKKKIVSFEEYVFKNFYVNQDLLDVLYNNGRAPDDVDVIITLAITNAITDGNGSINPALLDVNGDIDDNAISKAIYTLCMYKFINEDLSDNNITGSNYKTQALDLFNIRLLVLPGNARLFRVADYMRAEIPISLNTNTDLENIIHMIEAKTTVETKPPTIIPDRIAIRVSDMLDNTRSMALDIGAFNAWPPVRDMFLYIVIIYVCVIVALIVLAIIVKWLQKT